VNHPIVASLVPVVLLIAIGFLAGKRAWIGAGAVRDLSNMVFLLLAPALLFRTMAAQAHALQFGPVVVYFGAAVVLYAGMLAVLGFNTRGAVLALAGTFSNTVMIGTPLVSLAYGDAALVTHFALVALHALVLLTMATIVLELASAREALARGETGGRHMAATVGLAVRPGPAANTPSAPFAHACGSRLRPTRPTADRRSPRPRPPRRGGRAGSA
jgi:malonate transporter